MSPIEMELLTKILGYLIAGIFIYMIKPVIDVLVKKIESNEVAKFAIKAIRAAEQELSKDEWAEKKMQVLEQVGSYVSDHTNLELSGAEINTIIEGSIKEAKEIYNKENKGAE